MRTGRAGIFSEDDLYSPGRRSRTTDSEHTFAARLRVHTGYLPMRLTASDIYGYYRPTQCALRLYLRHKGEQEVALGPYEQVLLTLADRHEKAHVEAFPRVVNLSSVRWDERADQTTRAVNESAPVIYQGVLKIMAVLSTVECEVVGNPDFLINAGDGYLIRDSKISRRINENDHPEILRQLELYGWLYEQTFDKPPIRLEVHSGTGNIVPVPYDGGAAVRSLLGQILQLKLAESEFYEPVGWSKCESCTFFNRCWPIAEKRRDIALVGGIDQALAEVLWQKGIRSIEDLLANVDEPQLAALKRPWGNRLQRVGARAPEILRRARALLEGREFVLQSPQIPDHKNYVMFDLEGLPPQLDELEKIYLWGLQVYGENSGTYQAATAGFGDEGDRQGWEHFLAISRSIFEHLGDLPFVHWSHYERTKLETYIRRYGDVDGVAARVLRNLCDLLPITQDAMVLPLPSYGLKLVEAYVGFRRERPQAAGDWAMAKYIEAVETEDPEVQLAIMDEILSYNREDLAALWAVFEWLQKGRA